MQFEMFERDDKGIPGSQWWVGDWQCQNFHGYFRSREGGIGNWCFQIYAFGDDDCAVYALNKTGEMVLEDVPYDARDRITVLDKKYGRNFWAH